MKRESKKSSKSDYCIERAKADCVPQLHNKRFSPCSSEDENIVESRDNPLNEQLYGVEAHCVPEIYNMKFPSCSSMEENRDNSLNDKVYGIDEANRKVDSLRIINGYIQMELKYWETKLKFLTTHMNGNMILIGKKDKEISKSKLACLFENIDAL